MAGREMLLLMAMQVSLEPDKDLGTQGDMKRDTTREGGLTDMLTLTIGAEPLEPGHSPAIRESKSNSESFRVQVTLGVG